MKKVESSKVKHLQPNLMFFFYKIKLKVQEAMRKKEKFQRQHEEVSYSF